LIASGTKNSRRSLIEQDQLACSSLAISLRFQNPESALRSFSAVRACPLDACDQFLGDAQDTALGIRPSLAQPNVEDLTCPGPGGEQRLVAALLVCPNPTPCFW
jgi:hypothetical protein